MFRDIIKEAFRYEKKDPLATRAWKNIASGGTAGGLSLVFVYSLDYARTRMANDAKEAGAVGQRQFNGMTDVYLKTWKTDGIKGLYRGFTVSCVGIVVYRGFYFGLYDTLKPIIIGDKSILVLDFCLGYAITVTAGLMSYPIDTIRRRMMMTSGGGRHYKGSLDCAIRIAKDEGLSSFMKGAVANIFRGAAGAGVLAFFDKFKEFYIHIKYGD
mmetsp:Transcript_6669/g.3758  ORF Transcript_6669/g.3758 Transcript_6669/m.3758 type:complete len:213 (+) Transcript_6669:326-964(+)